MSLFSVIVPTCDRVDALSQCLDRLAPGAQSMSASDYEVIVTDDGRTVRAMDVLASRFPWVLWADGQRRGPAANRNNGARSARHGWLAFIDDDCLPDRHWLRGFASAIERDPSVRVLEGRTTAGGIRERWDETAPVNETGGFLWSCNFAIAAELFRQVGGFDERFPHAAMEDVELRIRLGGLNHVATFVPDASVTHPWRRIDLVPEVRRHVNAQLIFRRVHPEHPEITSIRFHLSALARYYGRDLFLELKRWGWRYLSYLPTLGQAHGYTLWTLWRNPEPMATITPPTSVPGGRALDGLRPPVG
jgi:GT2 family glycosyltransferase